MTEKEFKQALTELRIETSKEKLATLFKYYELLIEYNKTTNLTSITQKEQVYLKHFYDSLTIASIYSLEGNKKLLDVGCGAGFPGIVLKIFYPNLDITLLDSNNKKIVFLNYIIKALHLKHCHTVCTRCEEYAHNNIETYDIVTARAVAQTKILSELCLPLVKVKGVFIVMKGHLGDELFASKRIINELNGKIIITKEFFLNDSENKRSLILIEKQSPCPSKYPRSYSQILKSN